MHVVLAVDDVERAKRFYHDAFGWKPHLEWPDRYAELVLSEDDRLGLYVRDGFAAIEPTEIGDTRYTGAEFTCASRISPLRSNDSAPPVRLR